MRSPSRRRPRAGRPGLSALLPYAAVVAGVAAATLISALRGGDGAEYRARIAAHRAGVEHSLRSASSPLGTAARARLGGLDYYPPDSAYRVRGRLLPLPAGPEPDGRFRLDAEAVDLTGVSWAEFTVGGRTLRLLAFKSRGDASNRLFIPFRDATSGRETYGGGRYLDVYPQGGEEVEIDFNLAYNPYCAYDPDYRCPLAPPGNTLDVSIPAGEKAPSMAADGPKRPARP